MSSTPFMQLYVGDYLADTLHLTTEQHGAYLLLLMTMWRADAKLPNDPAKLARITRVSPKRWPKVWEAVAEFFVIDGDHITNPRLTIEYQKAVSISQERRNAGKKGGDANALKYKDAREASASDLPKHSQISEPDIMVGGGSAHASEAIHDNAPTFRERILAATGADPVSGLTGRGGQRIGTQADMFEAARWLDMGLTEAECIAQVVEVMAAKHDGAPSKFAYFTPAMARLAAAKAAPTPQPINASPATDGQAYHQQLDQIFAQLRAERGIAQ